MNDGAVATALLGALPSTLSRAQGLVGGFVAAEAGEAREQAMRAWKRFARQDPFWK